MAFLEGDEPPMTACGGNLIGGEIIRNEQSPHEAELRRLRMRPRGKPFFGLQRAVSPGKDKNHAVSYDPRRALSSEGQNAFDRADHRAGRVPGHRDAQRGAGRGRKGQQGTEKLWGQHRGKAQGFLPSLRYLRRGRRRGTEHGLSAGGRIGKAQNHLLGLQYRGLYTLPGRFCHIAGRFKRENDGHLVQSSPGPAHRRKLRRGRGGDAFLVGRDRRPLAG